MRKPAGKAVKKTATKKRFAKKASKKTASKPRVANKTASKKAAAPKGAKKPAAASLGCCIVSYMNGTSESRDGYTEEKCRRLGISGGAIAATHWQKGVCA